MKSLYSRVFVSALFAVALAGIFPAVASAGPGAAYWKNMQPITTTQEAESLPEGTATAMVCAKCKNVAVSTSPAEPYKQGVHPMSVGSQHDCGACGGTVTIVNGKEKDSLAMNCSKCGDGSAFCCAMMDTPKK